MITRDLKQLIEQAVDTSKADYAVFTGIQIHSWPNPESREPTLEFVQPVTSYTVTEGTEKEIQLNLMPAPAPRQLALLARGTSGPQPPLPDAMGYVSGTTVLSMDPTTMAA